MYIEVYTYLLASVIVVKCQGYISVQTIKLIVVFFGQDYTQSSSDRLCMIVKYMDMMLSIILQYP